MVNKEGRIERILNCVDSLEHVFNKYAHYERIQLSPSQFVIPGLIDTHAHAPQYFNAGLGLDLPLLEWLQTYTFPVESKFGNVQIAEQIYQKCVKRSLMNGTTTSVYFATIHNEAS